ncbi:MAG: hypothetical protein K1W22_10015 [Lachnospiraceae bacterium]
MWILALEASTTSAKAMCCNVRTGECTERVRSYGRMPVDVTCHDAKAVYESMIRAGRELAEGREIAMVSLSGTWHSVLLCDRNMEPVTPVYPWSYTGASALSSRLREDEGFVHAYYHRTGCMVNAMYPSFKLLHLRDLGYQIKDCYIMGQGTYHNYRLTGRRVTSRCMASGTGLLNIRTGEYDRESLEMAGVKREQLCALASCQETFPLSAEGAAALGIRQGIPVVITNADGGLNQLGAGAVREKYMTVSVGTSGALRLSTRHPVLPEGPSTWCYLSPKGWLSGAATAGGCNCIDWFIDRMTGGNAGYRELESGEGCITDTPVFMPFLFGERCPGWNDGRTGGFAYVKAEHDIRDLYRGILQGVLFHLYQCYELLTEAAGEPERIRLSGGILNSEIWTQMCADIFGREMEIQESKQGSLVGAVVLARELLGELRDARDYEPEIRAVVRPREERRRQYMEQYERYMQVYHREC